MKTCKACKAEIPDNAKKCSHCGCDQRSWFARHPVWTVLLFLIAWPVFLIYWIFKQKWHPAIKWGLTIVIILILGGFEGVLQNSKATTAQNGTSTEVAQSVSQSTNEPAATVAPTTAPIIIDATTLVGAYDKNKLAAQDKYTGKVVQTTAYISNISQDITGNYYLALNPTNDQYYTGTTLQCYFNDKSALTSLSNGQEVTVRGTMQDMSLGIVEMQNCGLVK